MFWDYLKSVLIENIIVNSYIQGTRDPQGPVILDPVGGRTEDIKRNGQIP